MKIKLFEEFINESEANEGMMSNIDIIFQQSSSKEAFKKEVKEFLAHHAADKSIANDEKFIEDLAMTFFDDDGKKKEIDENQTLENEDYGAPGVPKFMDRGNSSSLNLNDVLIKLKFSIKQSITNAENKVKTDESDYNKGYLAGLKAMDSRIVEFIATLNYINKKDIGTTSTG